MFTLSLRSNIDQAVRGLYATRQQIALATAKALTFTAERVREAERQEMRNVFDRPTSFTINSLYLRGATPARLEARVWFKELGSDWHYLMPQIYGGDRRLKQFEKYLQSSGWLPKGMMVVPGSRATLDSYGNINRGQLIQVLSALRALPQQGYLANRSARSALRKSKSKKGLVNYFVGRPHPGTPDGIWQRVGVGLRPIFIFVPAARYRKRFDFFGIANRVSTQTFDGLLHQELNRATSGRSLAAAA